MLGRGFQDDPAILYCFCDHFGFEIVEKIKIPDSEVYFHGILRNNKNKN